MAMVEEKPTIAFVRDEIAEIILLIATDKGAFLYFSDADRRHWDVTGPHFMGSIVHHIVLDPRDNQTLLASIYSHTKGPDIYRSKDFGKTWTPTNKASKFNEKLKQPPHHTICLLPGHPEDINTWYTGTSQGIFHSKDGGDNWDLIAKFNQINLTKNNQRKEHSLFEIHSIIINPANKQHMYLSMSNGGVLESYDQGINWASLNNGIHTDSQANSEIKSLFDSFSIITHPINPNRIYQQSNYGLYRLEEKNKQWKRIGHNLPKEIGDLGLPIAIHPNEPDTIWTFPIDQNEPRSKVCPGGQPALYCTKDAGDSWFRQDIGLPMRNAWLTVNNKSLSTDSMVETGVYFGTTSGTIWMSNNEGNSWRQIALHLPQILAVETGKILKK